MRPCRLATAVFLAWSFSIATAVAGDPENPPKVAPQSAVITLKKNFQPISISNELATIKALVREIDQRIRRVELLTEYEQAVNVRNDALAAWKKSREENGTLTKAVFDKRDYELRTGYYEARWAAEEILLKLNEFYK